MASLAEFKAEISASRSPNTGHAYYKGAKRFIAFLHARKIPLVEVQPNILQDFVVYLVRQGVRPRSIQLYLVGARHLLDWLKDRGVAVPDGIKKPSVPRPETKESETIDSSVLRSWLTAASRRPDPYRTVLMILPFIGLRCEEVCTLQVKDITTGLNGVFISIRGKGRKRRRVPLSTEAKRILLSYFRNNEGVQSNKYLFSRPNGDRISTGDVRREVQAARADADMPWITAHKLRHIFATLLSRNGVGIEVIRDLLGHESISTTTIYIHPDDATRVDAVEKVQ